MNEQLVKVVSASHAKANNGYPLYVAFKNAALPVRSMGQTGLDLLRDAILSYLHYALDAIQYDENQIAGHCVRYAEYYYHSHTIEDRKKIMELLKGLVFDQIQLLPIERARKSFLATDIYENIHAIIIAGIKQCSEVVE
ncbi:MAG: hypothetical protein IJ056_08395 [Acidaminococcaceae bacterium]|nr:hypothetical protein [Acidaminococcaceae bacterium]MBQ9696937.1 hypothetical protein [Acidaminococcaceae bacterium]